MSSRAFWSDGTIKSQGTFAWRTAIPQAPTETVRPSRLREQQQAYRKTDAGRATKSIADAKYKAKLRAGLAAIPASAVLVHEVKPKTGRAGSGFRTI